ncbi:DUF6520 family protein [Zunongwangia profunda]|nr:DUF6520 family protein [Zunongwangia profunda]
MKTKKFLMPVMAIAMAVGLAFSTKADVQSNGWVERDGASYQLQTDPCNSSNQAQCEVIFTDDPGTVHQVYMDEALSIPKPGGSGGLPYEIED